MNARAEVRRIRDLCRLLEQLRGAYEKLADLTRQRIAAMARADAGGINECLKAEEELLGIIKERLGLRVQLMNLIGGQLGLPAGMGRVLTLRQLAGQLTGEPREQIERAAEVLRSAAFSAAQAQRIASAVTRDVLLHLRWVFEAIRPQGEFERYGSGGQRLSVESSGFFEAVG